MKLSLAKLCPTIQVAEYLAWENFMHLFFNSSQSCTTILSHIKVGYKTRRLGEGKKVRDECHIIWSNYIQSLTSICLTYECPCIYKWVLQGGSAKVSLCCTPPSLSDSQISHFPSCSRLYLSFSCCCPIFILDKFLNTWDTPRNRREDRNFKEKENINVM